LALSYSDVFQFGAERTFALLGGGGPQGGFLVAGSRSKDRTKPSHAAVDRLKRRFPPSRVVYCNAHFFTRPKNMPSNKEKLRSPA